MVGTRKGFGFRINDVRFRGNLLLLFEFHNRLIFLLSTQGKETQSNENDDEDKYDLKKIISFPGFNVAAPHGTRDVS